MFVTYSMMVQLLIVPWAGRGGGYFHKFLIGVCCKGSYLRMYKNDTLLNSQTQKMTPYKRKNQKLLVSIIYMGWLDFISVT